MTYTTADYSEVDPVLDRWAVRHGIEWVRDDRGWDIRTLYWPVSQPKSVQLWVDEPINGEATVHVCHNTSDGGQQHTQARAAVADLEPVLDESLEKARSLADELKRKISAED